MLTGSKHSAFLKGLPKIELHLHLEGAIPLESLWTLIKKYDGHKELGNDIRNLYKKFMFKDFPHFIETWIWKNQFLKEYEDFEFIARGVAEDLLSQNIRYAEIFFTPGDHTEKGLELQRIIEFVAKGIFAESAVIEIKLVYDFSRDSGPVRALEQLQKLKDMINYGIIGIGLGGSEQLYPPEPFKEVFEKARSYGFHTTAHAGEAAGAESIWGALTQLKVERIGHGTRSYEDPALVAYLQNKEIPIECCPISNVRTGVVSSVAAHPLKSYFKNGLKICINTDDPKMFNNSLEDEYTCLIDELGFSLSDLRRLLSDAVDSAWCDDEKKESLESELDDYWKESGI